jgi:hypothetical protein
MSDFFPRQDEPVYEPEFDDDPQPVWLNPPEDVLPGVVPVELVIGRSDHAVVMLSGMRAFPIGLAMTLHVRLRHRIRRFALHEEVFDGPYRHGQGKEWQQQRLKWGFEYSDGRRATNIDWEPEPSEGPVLSGGGGGGSAQTADRDYWLWPLPPSGPLKIVCQWPQLGIEPTTSLIDGSLLVTAAGRAQPFWSD